MQKLTILSFIVVIIGLSCSVLAASEYGEGDPVLAFPEVFSAGIRLHWGTGNRSAALGYPLAPYSVENNPYMDTVNECPFKRFAVPGGLFCPPPVQEVVVEAHWIVAEEITVNVNVAVNIPPYMDNAGDCPFYPEWATPKDGDDDDDDEYSMSKLEGDDPAVVSGESTDDESSMMGGGESDDDDHHWHHHDHHKDHHDHHHDHHHGHHDDHHHEHDHHHHGHDEHHRHHHHDHHRHHDHHEHFGSAVSKFFSRLFHGKPQFDEVKPSSPFTNDIPRMVPGGDVVSMDGDDVVVVTEIDVIVDDENSDTVTDTVIQEPVPESALYEEEKPFEPRSQPAVLQNNRQPAGRRLLHKTHHHHHHHSRRHNPGGQVGRAVAVITGADSENDPITDAYNNIVGATGAGRQRFLTLDGGYPMCSRTEWNAEQYQDWKWQSIYFPAHWMGGNSSLSYVSTVPIDGVLCNHFTAFAQINISANLVAQDSYAFFGGPQAHNFDPNLCVFVSLSDPTAPPVCARERVDIWVARDSPFRPVRLTIDTDSLVVDYLNVQTENVNVSVFRQAQSWNCEEAPLDKCDCRYVASRSHSWLVPSGSLCNAHLTPTWIFAVLIGILGGVYFLNLGSAVVGSRSYAMTFFTYAIMISSGFVTHSILSGDCAQASSSSALSALSDSFSTNLFSPASVSDLLGSFSARSAVVWWGLIDVTLTSTIAVSFLYNALVDLRWMSEKGPVLYLLWLFTVPVLAHLYMIGWQFVFLYNGLIAICCTFYVAVEIILMIRARSASGIWALLFAGVSGAIGMYSIMSVTGCKLCLIYGGGFREVFWYWASDFSMLFIAYFVSKTRRHQQEEQAAVDEYAELYARKLQSAEYYTA